MKKSKLVNVIVIMIVGLSILLMAKETLAANTVNTIDITNTLTSGNSTTNNTTSGSSSTTGNNTTGNNTTTNNNILTTNNTSNYTNNSNSLPKTGIEDSISGVILVVILGISAVYAYNKIKYYRNI